MRSNDGHTGAASVPTKFVYLAPRPEKVDRAAFGRHWRERSDGVAQSGQFTHYEQCETLTPADEPALPESLFGPLGISGDFAGVAQAWFVGGSGAVADLATDTTWAASTGGEAQPAPARPAGNLLATQEEVVFDLGGTKLKIFSFLQRRAGLSLAEFSDQWRAFAQTFAAHDELVRHCSGYVQNHVYAPDGRPRYDGIAEMSFRSVDDVVAFISEPSMVEELFPAEQPFIDRTDVVVVLTRRLEA